jgi:hypothetical protein
MESKENMSKLTADQQKQLDDLTALASAPDDDDYEIEICNGDRRARVPYRKGRSYLQEHFGIDLDPPAADADDTETGDGKDPNPPDTRVSGKYFGKGK